jgi:hypothetical protein
LNLTPSLKFQKREFSDAIEITREKKFERWEGFISELYFLLNKEDSAKVYANKALKKDDNDAFLYALKGNKTKAFELIDSFCSKKIESGEDKFAASWCRISSVIFYALLKDYPKARQELIQLNEQLPEFSNYDYFNDPVFDRIKKEISAVSGST